MSRTFNSLLACRLSLVATAALLLGAGCEPGGIPSDWKRIDPSVEAPPFTLPTLDGASVSLSDARGRIVLVEFWATWCGPCRYSMPSLEAIYKRYRDQGVSVLLINEGEEAAAVRAWAKRRFTAPILFDADQAVGRRYRVEGLPRLFIVDRDGRIVYAHAGYGGGLERNLTLLLDGLLVGKATADHG